MLLIDLNHIFLCDRGVLKKWIFFVNDTVSVHFLINHLTCLLSKCLLMQCCRRFAVRSAFIRHVFLNNFEILEVYFYQRGWNHLPCILQNNQNRPSINCHSWIRNYFNPSFFSRWGSEVLLRRKYNRSCYRKYCRPCCRLPMILAWSEFFAFKVAGKKTERKIFDNI